MAEDYLGISAHFDVDEFLSGFNALIEKLKEAGEVSGEVCDQITSALIAIQNNLSNELQAEGIEKLNEDILKLSSAVNGAMASLNSSDGLVSLEIFKEYGTAIEAIAIKTQDAYQKEKDSLAQVQQAVDAAREARDKLASAGGDEFDKANVAYREACDILLTQTQRVEELETALQSLNNAQEQINQKIQASEGVTKETCDQISTALQGVLSSLGSISAGGLEDVNALLLSFKDALASTDGSELSKLGQSFNDLVGLIEEAVRKTSEAYAGESEKARQLASDSQKLKDELNNTALSGSASADEIAKLENKYLETAQASYEASQKCAEYRETLDNLNGVLSSVKDSAQQASESVESTGSAWSKAKDAIADWATGGGKAKEAMVQLKDGLNALPGPLGGAVTGFKKMLSAVKLFLATPIGRVLGVIVFLLQAFKTWATKSAEGQRVMAKVSAYLGSVLQSLTDILIKVGSYLFHAFADAQGPMHDFATGLVTTLKYAVSSAAKLLGGLGDTLKGIINMFKGDFAGGWDLMTSGLSSVWDAVKDAGHALENGVKTAYHGVVGTAKMIGDGVGALYNTNGLELMKGINRAALESMEISKEREEVEQNITANKEKQLDYENRINAAKQQAKDTEDKGALRRVMSDLRTTTSDQFGDQVKLQEEEVKRLEKEAKLHQQSIKDQTALQVATLQLYMMEKKREASLRALDAFEKQQEKRIDRKEAKEQKAEERKEKAAKREAERAKKKEEREAKAEKREEEREKRKAERQARLTAKQQEKADKAAAKYEKSVEKYAYESAKEQLEVDEQLEEARVNAMEEGAAKRYALRQLEHRKQMSEIDKNAAEREHKEIERQKKMFDELNAMNKEQGLEPLKFELDKGPIEKIRKDAEELKKYQQQMWDAEEAKELADKYKGAYDERIEIEEKFNEDISNLIALRNKAAEDEKWDDVDRLTRFIAKAERDRGANIIKKIIAEIKERPENIEPYEDLGKAAGATIQRIVEQFNVARDAAEKAGLPVKEIDKEISKLFDQLAKNEPFVAMIQAAEDAKNAQEEIVHAQEELDNFKQMMASVQSGAPVPKNVEVVDGKIQVDWMTEADVQQKINDAQEKVNKAKENYINVTHRAMDASKSAIGVIDGLRSSFESLGKAIGGDIGDIMGFIGSIAGMASKGITSIFSSAKDLDKANAAVKVAKDMGNASAEAGAKMEANAAKAQMWMAAMTAMIQIISAVQNILPTSDSLYEKYAEKQKEVNNLRRAVEDYRLSVLLAQQAEKGWFARSGLSSLTDAYEKHGKVVEAYYAKLYEAQEKYHNKSAGLSKALPYIAAVGAVIATVVTAGAAGVATLGALAATVGTTAAQAVTVAAIGAVTGAVTAAAQSAVAGITYKNGQVAAKDNLRMQTRHKTWFRGEKTQDLVEWTRENLNAELFDDEGLINLEAAQTILNRYGDKLVGETKETLEDLVNLRKQYNEFMEQVEKYVSDLYSPLVDDMTEALFDWLKNGTDVLYQFRQNAKDTFAAIAKDMVRQMMLSSIFEPYSEALKKIYAQYAAMGKGKEANNFLINGVMSATDEFLANAEGVIPTLQDALTQINDKFAERGFDLTQSSDEGNAAYKATQSFSQEQGDELNGRLTAIQIGQQQGIVQRTQLIELQGLTLGAVVQINTALLASAGDISAMRDMQYIGLQRLAEISMFTSVLPAMAENITDMRNDIRTKL